MEKLRKSKHNNVISRKSLKNVAKQLPAAEKIALSHKAAKIRQKKRSSHPTIIPGRITKTPHFFGGGLRSKTIRRVEDTEDAFLPPPLRNGSSNRRNMDEIMELSPSLSDTTLRQLSSSSKKKGITACEAKENRSVLKLIHDSYNNLISEKGAKSSMTAAVDGAYELSTHERACDLDDPFYLQDDGKIFDGITDFGDKIARNRHQSTDALEMSLQNEIYGPVGAPAQPPVPPPSASNFLPVEMQKEYASFVSEFGSPPKAFSTPETQRIKPIILETSARKAFIWVAAGDEEKKKPNRNRTVGAKNNEVRVISTRNPTLKSSGLYELSADVSNITKSSVVNLDAQCKPVFQIVSRNDGQDKQVVVNKEKGLKRYDSVPEKDENFLFEFLSATQRRPEKVKRALNVKDLMPKKLSFSETEANANKRQRTIGAAGDDLGCELLPFMRPLDRNFSGFDRNWVAGDDSFRPLSAFERELNDGFAVPGDAAAASVKPLFEFPCNGSPARLRSRSLRYVAREDNRYGSAQPQENRYATEALRFAEGRRLKETAVSDVGNWSAFTTFRQAPSGNFEEAVDYGKAEAQQLPRQDSFYNYEPELDESYTDKYERDPVNVTPRMKYIETGFKNIPSFVNNDESARNDFTINYRGDQQRNEVENGFFQIE